MGFFSFLKNNNNNKKKTGANKSYWASVSIFYPFYLTRTGDEMVEKVEIDFLPYKEAMETSKIVDWSR